MYNSVGPIRVVGRCRFAAFNSGCCINLPPLVADIAASTNLEKGKFDFINRLNVFLLTQT